MKIQRYKDDWYKYFYEKCSQPEWYETAEVPDEVYQKLVDTEKAYRDAEVDVGKYFK